jgi:predicted metalloendopeptidase
MNRFTKEQLSEKAEKMQSYLSEQYANEPNDLLQRLEYLTLMVSQSGKMLADSKYYQDEIVNGAILEAIKKAYEEKLSASTINLFVKSAAKDFNYLVNWISEINHSAGKQIDALRTIISYRKSEMNIL